MTNENQNEVLRGSCPDCKAARESNDGILVSWRDAEVLVVGCKKHVKEITDCFTESQKAKIRFLRVAEEG